MIDYALWEVIENGATLPKTKIIEGVMTEMPITSDEDKAQRRLEDAKKLLEAVENRFDGNSTTRKTQRNLLKQQYENIIASRSEMLDQTFDRLQKLVSQLELLDEKLSQEDVNQKLLRSLSPERNTHAVVWRNKDDLDTMSMDDLYNNLKVYEPEVKGMSSSISTASTQVNATNCINIDNLSNAIICAFFTSQPNSPQLVHEDLQQIYRDDMEEMANSHVDYEGKKVFKEYRKEANYDEEEDVSQPKTEKKTVRPSIVKKELSNIGKTLIVQVGNPQMDLQDQGVIDSGCSRHMTWNMSYLTDYEEIDGGYVAFGGNPKGGKITRKGTIKTSNLDFENVYFVRELKFNLFSVSQMCDKKNSVLFNDTECIVLSPNFKLIDESQVLLRVPRKNNMYSVDLKNIVPKGGLTCLFAKATSDESKLWHRRLGHLNFKTMNKLVKGNLVRGLPSKLFENDQTCVACQKGKQHRASCKSKTENSISLPLHLLHMDLFGPTFVKSLKKKMYCLVVTDDYSRFTWVFFLATKDETSSILKSFITGIENLVDHKVKVIRCDNGIEFKNREMNNFCENEGSGPDWLFDIDALTRTMNYETSVVKSSHDDGSKPLSEDGKKVDEDPRKDSKCKDQEKEDNVNNTNNVNTVSSTVNVAGTNKVNAVGGKTSIELPFDLNMPALEDYSIFDFSRDDEMNGALLT
ncbi:putative ribonuclease H-like domain-containing protein [Tanacetum coccineum]